MEFASYLPDWPAYVLVFIALIVTAISIDRFSWFFVVGAIAVLAAYAVADAFPTSDSRVIKVALYLAAVYAVKYLFRKRSREPSEG